MWADAQHDGRPDECRWRPLWKFFHSLYHAAKFGWWPLLQRRGVMLPIQENARLGPKWSLHLAKLCQGAKAFVASAKVRFINALNNNNNNNNNLKNVYSIPNQETAKHRARFGWPPVSDVAAVTKPRRETCWNLLGYPKLANWSQPLVGRSSPNSGDIWMRYCCLTTFFSDCQCMP